MDYSQIACGLVESHLTDWHGKSVHRDIVNDLSELTQAAKQAGFDLRVASGHRNFERQAAIWNGKFAGQRPVFDLQGRKITLTKLSEFEKCQAIMLFSALPGASRHHFGSDLDVYAKNCLEPTQSLQLEPWEYDAGGPFAEFNLWLDEHILEYGFFRPYACFQGGVAREPWHISHLSVASLLEQYQSIDNIAATLTAHDVLGKQCILHHLPELYRQYICNITRPA
ncbi:M15 family metallopeptidase [Pseudoalteromonas sp. JBTF-M23]|uniref:M15 family metallopeptidase n=1 Tax=Pseudoalteromonas caenipelagi TaxID=2726988 RepID=A0A849V6M0_9GAMM|nr:M15 family metallopeptidase [Pseudoalteromonas caenipelagi]NOU48952.1 M15 family metallopeptidase [Pseudoalteromonas caenipelagi]